MNAHFEEWRQHLFDEGAITSEKYFSVAVFEAEASDSETVEFVEFLFRRAGDLTQFTDAQLNKGFWHLTSPCLSNYMFPVRDGDVPLAKKLSAIDSIYSLYADCFAKRCTETLSDIDEKGSALNSICYMFWDVCILTYLEKTSEETALAETVFSVLEKTLTIEHRACREGALHGLNHLAPYFPDQVAAVSDSFLCRTTLDEDLLNYARRAAKGMCQ